MALEPSPECGSHLFQRGAPRVVPETLVERDDRGVAPVLESPALARGQLVLGEDGHQLLADLRRLEVRDGVEQQLVGVLGGVPLEELLQRAELVAGVGVGVAAQQGNRPLLDMPRPHVSPVSDPARNHVLGGHPLRGLDVGTDHLQRLALRFPG